MSSGGIETGTADLLYARSGAIGTVTLHRPAVRNALTFEMYDALISVCEAVAADDTLAVLVVTGSGEAFAAGTDIAQFQSFTRGQDALDYEALFERAVALLEALPQPTLAVVPGDAVGGGAALLLACDLRICTPAARFGVPIARTLGNCLSVPQTARLVQAIGALRTRELLFTGRLATAAEALALGLVNEVVPPEQLAARAAELAGRIAANAPLTVRIAKEAVRRTLLAARPGPDDALILRAYQSEDFREGIASFLGKRRPVWKGR